MERTMRHFIILPVIFIWLISFPAEAQRNEPSPEMQEKISGAVSEIEQVLSPLLDHINESGTVGESDRQVLEQVLKKTIPFVLRMEEPDQAKFFLLSSWTSYFEGDSLKALKESLKAFKLDPENADVRSTLTSMSLITGNYSSLSPLKLFYQKQEEGGSFSEGTLKIDKDSIFYEMLGKSAPAGVFSCLNGEKLELANDVLYAFVMWKIAYAGGGQTSETTGGTLFGQSDSQVDSYDRSDRQIDQEPIFDLFGELCIANYDNDLLGFVSINCDADPDYEKIYQYLIHNGGPWAQVVLDDPNNNFARYLMNIRINQPTLLMVYEGKIVYLGTLESFLPQLIISSRTHWVHNNSSAIESLSNEQAPDQTEQPQPVIEPAPEVNEIVIEHQRQEQTVNSKPDETQQLVDDIRAQKLLERVKLSFNRRGVTTYKDGVEACREILRDYPNTVQAVQAREMLRSLPDRYKERYNVTEEELGN